MKITILEMQGEIGKLGISFSSEKMFILFDNEVTLKIHGWNTKTAAIKMRVFVI